MRLHPPADPNFDHFFGRVLISISNPSWTDFGPNLASKIDPELDGRAAGLWKGFGADDSSNTNFNMQEVIEADQGHDRVTYYLWFAVVSV